MASGVSSIRGSGFRIYNVEVSGPATRLLRNLLVMIYLRTDQSPVMHLFAGSFIETCVGFGAQVFFLLAQNCYLLLVVGLPLLCYEDYLVPLLLITL